MNSSEPSGSGGWLMSSGKIGGFAYGIGVSVGILVIITTITLTSYYCARNHLSASPTTTPRTRRRRHADDTPGPLDHHRDDTDDLAVVEVSGLDEETITSYPKLPYDEARVSYSSQKNSSTTSCCSICLADYKSSDTIRVLPDCNHLFHDKCVDPWLRLHPTCPVCRTSPIPTPVATPFVEVAPLAGQSRD